jgi:4-amino-4-deoxy-L-arabinose transferase-like glycosyltransferase
MTHREGRAVLFGVALINLVLSLCVHWAVLKGFPNSGDEYSYLLGAELLASGRLSAPASPEPRAAFKLNQTLNDDRFYSKYPPGWPAVLATGVRLGVPWLVNPLVGALTLLLLYRLASRHFSPRIAVYALVSLCASPYFVFMSASYFSQPVALLWATMFLLAFYEVYEGGRGVAAAAMAIAAGLLFLSRPFTSVAIVVPLLVVLVVRARRGGRGGDVLRGLAIFSAAFLPFLLAYGLYNRALTGSPWYSPFELYDPVDRPFRTHEVRGAWWSLKHNVVERLALLNLWQPFSVMLLGLFLFQRRDALSEKARPLLIAFVCPVVAHFFYFIGAGNEYGPRYLYEELGALVILGAVALSRQRRLAPALLALIVIANVGWLYSRTRVHAGQARERMQPFELARQQGLRDAIVFIAPSGSGDMVARDLTRNGLAFDGPVLFVLDGVSNAEVMARFPNRSAYRYQYDASTGTGTLTRIR